MNCQKFEEVVGDLVREQMMQAAIRTDALLHADDCVPCQKRLQEEESLSHTLNGLAVEMHTLNASPALEKKLLEAFSARQQIVIMPNGTTNRRYWLAAAAAVLLIGFALITWSWSHRQSPPAPVMADNSKDENPGTFDREIVKSPANNNDAPAVVTEKALATKIKKIPRIRQSQLATNLRVDRKGEGNVNQQTMVALNSSPREIATEFLPLGSMSEASLQDGGQIVRVEMPRSALVNFGLPVNMDRYNERVKADLLVGVDGLAHAIRFVQ